MGQGQGSNESSKRRRLWLVVVGLSALVAALVVLATQQGGDGDGSLNAITAAAERTQEEPGGRTAMRAVFSSPGESFKMRGDGVFDAEERTQATMTFRRPGSDELIEMQMISSETTMFMSSDLFGPLPGGAKWMGIDLSSLGGSEAPLPTDSDAMGELALLETVADDVRKLGREHVRGVSTTRYRGVIDVSERAEQLREEGAKEFASEMEAGRPLRVDAWIDADGLVRSMRYVKVEREEEGEKAMTMSMRMDFFDFGIEPEIELPDPSEVFDATGVAEEEVGASSG